MSDRQLRAGLIRLAHTRPELREHILPLVTERVAGSKRASEALTIGSSTLGSEPVTTFFREAAKVAFGVSAVEDVYYENAVFGVRISVEIDDDNTRDFMFEFNPKLGKLKLLARKAQALPFNLWESSVADAARVMKQLSRGATSSSWSTPPDDYVPPLQETHPWAYTER
ncbi:MAG: hypothetical protein EBT79_07540 [Actinobacteria bacterium]|nr:hypothetical protein [Actinomycetota bacterium]NBR67112.1 hypothetical protein [Actinomycetota bacterium]